jgi:hypothetical protein
MDNGKVKKIVLKDDRLPPPEKDVRVSVKSYTVNRGKTITEQVAPNQLSMQV